MDAEDPPTGYNLDDNRVRLGHEERAFAAGGVALARWAMFPAPWTNIFPANAPIEAGTVVAMQTQTLSGWWRNACRIVLVVNEMDGPVPRFGFAYGTLAEHVERGEERFRVERRDADSVWYDRRAFSQPRYWTGRLAKPLARRLQRKFGRDSPAAMRRVVTRDTGESTA